VNGITRFREYVYAIFEQHITVLIATYVAPTCVSLDVRMGHCSSDDFSKLLPVVVVHLVANIYICSNDRVVLRGNATHRIIAEIVDAPPAPQPTPWDAPSNNNRLLAMENHYTARIQSPAAKAIAAGSVRIAFYFRFFPSYIYSYF